MDRPHEMLPLLAEGVEYLGSYQEGGFHPVHLGDIYNGRYEVVHKLGHGGFATVWLCLDQRSHQWRALKIAAADDSDETESDLKLLSMLQANGLRPEDCENHHLTFPTDHFYIDGANGRHLCCVFPLLGRTISGMDVRDPRNTFQQIFRQVGKALAFLHGQGICHGDITPKNILFRLEDTSRISREEMLRLVGGVGVEYVRTRTGKSPSPRYPAYVVGPADLSRLKSTGDVSLVDYGQCFRADEAPEYIATPNQYCAPEVRIGDTPGFSSDLWALACTIVEARTCVTLFPRTDTIGKLIEAFRVYLGPLPEPYLSTRIEELTGMMKRAEGSDAPEYEGLREVWERQLEHLTGKRAEGETTGERERYLAIIKERTGQENPFLAEIAVTYILPDGTVTKPWSLAKRELDSLGDLITRTLKYHPEDRLTLEEILHHPWFQEPALKDCAAAPECSLKSPGTPIENHPGSSIKHASINEAPPEARPPENRPTWSGPLRKLLALLGRKLHKLYIRMKLWVSTARR